MDGFSILDGSWLEPLANQREYNIGNAIGWLSRDEKQAATNHSLAGRLYVAKSGWLLLSVPNALVRGVYDALATPGAELPRAGLLNVPNVPGDVLNAHISVMNAVEVKKIGAENINERGHMVGYSLGALKEITPRNIDGVSKVWALQVSSPMLSAIRKSYGLSPLLNGHSFHITVAVRRKSVLQENSVSKAAAHECNCSGCCTCPPDCACKQRCHTKQAAASPQPRVRVVMPYKNQYLMETLNNSKWPENIGKRRFIGGGIEKGETPEQAAAREMFEELGVKIKPTAFRPLGNDPREGWQHEHYLELLKHKLKPGNFNATVGSDAVVTLSHGLPEGDDYMGPDIKKLLVPVLKAAMAAEKQHSNALSRSGQKDLLPGGKADNLPDREFSSSELAEGAEHEHEHTDNDQVAKEIAKDHLQEDSQYYEKVEAIEGKEAASSVMPMPPKPKEAPPAETAPPEMPPPVVNDVSFGVVPPPALPPSGQQLPDPTKQQEDEQKQAEDIKRVLKDLRAAKAHSDNKRYDQKTQILRRLMEQSPHDWKIDDPKPYHKGITHKNTNFRFHVEPTAIPESVKVAYRQPRSAYMTSLYNSYGLHRPLRYNYDKTVAENIQEQLMEVKRRGDFMRAAKQNHQRYMAALDPKYRYELAMKAMNNEMEEEPMVDRVIGQYGDSFINTVFGRPK